MPDSINHPSSQADAADEAIRTFADELARLRELHGNPSFDRMHSAIRHITGVAGSKNTFHRMINKPDRIYGPEFVRGFVLALGLSEAAANEWEQRRLRALRQHQISRDAVTARNHHDHPLAKRGRTRRRLTVTLAAIAAVLIVAIPASMLLVGNINRSAKKAHAAAGDTHRSAASGVALPRDGADPENSGCSSDPKVVILDSAEVDYDGAPAGLDELVYSPQCGVAWARFQPFPKAGIPAGAIINVYVIRPSSNNFRLSFQAPYVGAPVYGNVLHSTQYCVYAAAAIQKGRDELPVSRTRCFRGETPVS
jgi:hypothetical protein